LASIFKPRTHKTAVVDTAQKKTKSKKQSKSKEKEKQASLVWRPSSQEVQESFLLRIDVSVFFFALLHCSNFCPICLIFPSLSNAFVFFLIVGDWEA